MKTKNLFTTVLISVLAFTACSNDEEVNNSREEIKIAASIDGATTGNLKATFNSDGSGTFQPGDKYMLYYFSATLGQGGGIPYNADGTTPLYWDQVSSNNNPVDFFATYPIYEFSGSMILAYKIAAATTEAAKDLLMTPKVTVSKGNTVNLQFKHVMHKLAVNISSNYYTSSELDAATISLKNLKSDASVDFFNGTLDKNSASGTDTYASQQGASTKFIVAPQTLIQGTEILDITISGKIFKWTVPTTLTELESGKILTLNLSVNRNNVVLNAGNITGWDNQGSITESIAF